VYVTFALVSEKSVPSSSQSPLMNGMSATLPCSTRFCGASGRKSPSARGSQARTSDCRPSALARPTLVSQRKLAHLVREDVW
jgi:hypothetical protein